MTQDVKNRLQHFKGLLEEKSFETLKNELAEASFQEVVELFNSPDGIGETRDLVLLFRLLSKDRSLEVFESMNADQQERLLNAFSDDQAVELLSELDPDDRARLLGEVPAKIAKKLIRNLSKEEREKTDLLLNYPPETAGRIMTPDYVSLKKEMSVKEALDKLRRNKEEMKDKETIYALFVVDKERRLIGALSLRDLVLAEEEEKVEDIMNTEIIKIWTREDQEKVAKVLQDHDLLALPVVDREDRLVGIVTVDDAMDVMEQEATEDMFEKAGLSALHQKELGKSASLVRGNLFKVCQVRIPFLLITLVGGMLAGAVIDTFEETLAAVTAVAIFIPAIMDMGGNTGTQSSTIFTRAWVLGQIDVKNFLRYFFREIGIGLTMGVLLGIMAAFVATFWQGNPWLGAAVGLSMALTMTLAAMLGFLIPYLLVKAGFDQAAGSDPILTTLKDITGLTIYFYSCIFFLSHML